MKDFLFYLIAGVCYLYLAVYAARGVVRKIREIRTYHSGHRKGSFQLRHLRGEGPCQEAEYLLEKGLRIWGDVLKRYPQFAQTRFFVSVELPRKEIRRRVGPYLGYWHPTLEHPAYIGINVLTKYGRAEPRSWGWLDKATGILAHEMHHVLDHLRGVKRQSEIVYPEESLGGLIGSDEIYAKFDLLNPGELAALVFSANYSRHAADRLRKLRKYTGQMSE